jgi:hypothetical protein
MSKTLALIAAAAAVAGLASAIDNGKGITPPMGWRRCVKRAWAVRGAAVDNVEVGGEEAPGSTFDARLLRRRARAGWALPGRRRCVRVVSE